MPKPDYDEIARLERELGIGQTDPPPTPPPPRRAPGREEKPPPGPVLNYVASAINPYSVTGFGPKRPLIYGPDGKPLT